MPQTFRSLPSDLRQKINAHLNHSGLDGNNFFPKASNGLSKSFEILSQYGIEMDQVISAHLLSRDSGNFSVDLAFTNPNDSFSPVAISNSMLFFSFHKMESGNFECISYLS